MMTRSHSAAQKILRPLCLATAMMLLPPIFGLIYASQNVIAWDAADENVTVILKNNSVFEKTNY